MLATNEQGSLLLRFRKHIMLASTTGYVFCLSIIELFDKFLYSLTSMKQSISRCLTGSHSVVIASRDIENIASFLYFPMTNS